MKENIKKQIINTIVFNFISYLKDDVDKEKWKRYIRDCFYPYYGALCDPRLVYENDYENYKTIFTTYPCIFGNDEIKDIMIEIFNKAESFRKKEDYIIKNINNFNLDNFNYPWYHENYSKYSGDEWWGENSLW